MTMNALSFLQDVAGFTQAQSGPKPRVRLGTIDSSYVALSFLSGTLPKVTFDGEATLSGKTYPVMYPYWPHADDRVVLVPFVVGNTTKYVITGTLDSVAYGYFGGDLNVGGDLTVDDVTANDITAGLLRLTDTGEASISSTAHALQIGPSNGQNLRMDPNEIQSVNNGAVGNLLLNQQGGAVLVGTSSVESGQVFHAASIRKRIVTSVVTTDGSVSANETAFASVTANLVSGRTYEIVCDTAVGRDADGGTVVVGDRIVCRILEDALGGTSIQVRNRVVDNIAGTVGCPVTLLATYTASSTGNKTFFATYDSASVNTCKRLAGSDFPTIMYVDYVSG